MKLVKISAIAFAVSAVLAGPVLAQGASSDTQIRGGAQGRTNMQGGASGAGEEDLNAQQTAPGEKAGVNAKSRGTVGAATERSSCGPGQTVLSRRWISFFKLEKLRSRCGRSF